MTLQVSAQDMNINSWPVRGTVQHSCVLACAKEVCKVHVTWVSLSLSV